MDLRELEAIASREMTKHGLHGWTFRFADTKRQLGVCKYRRKRIEIAKYDRSVVRALARGWVRHGLKPALRQPDFVVRASARPTPARASVTASL